MAVATTQITLWNRSLTRIEAVSRGDKVVCQKNGKTKVRAVLSIKSAEVDSTWRVRVRNPDNVIVTLDVTGQSCFCIAGPGGEWAAADPQGAQVRGQPVRALQPGDDVVCRKRTSSTVIDITQVNQRARIFALCLEGGAAYYANSVLVLGKAPRHQRVGHGPGQQLPGRRGTTRRCVVSVHNQVWDRTIAAALAKDDSLAVVWERHWAEGEWQLFYGDNVGQYARDCDVLLIIHGPNDRFHFGNTQMREYDFLQRKPEYEDKLKVVSIDAYEAM